MSVEELIKTKPYLQDILKNMPEDIKRRLKIVKLSPKDIMLKKDEEAKYVYILHSGTLRVINEFPNGNIYGFAYIDSTDFIGALEVLAEEPKIAGTVEAVTECITLRLSKNDFIKWFENDLHFSVAIAKLLAKKFYPTIYNNGAVFMNSSKHSLAQFIIRSVEEDIRVGKVGAIKKKRQHIADELGLSLRTVQRVIKSFKEDSIITIIKGKIHVDKKQYEKLNKIVKEL